MKHLFLFAGVLAITAPARAEDEHFEARAESAENFALVAHDPLQARQTYQIVQHQQGDRWYLYLGHLRGAELNSQNGEVEQNGVSVVDVTDPENPAYIRHIPPTPAPWSDASEEERSGGQHVQLCSGDQLPGGISGHHYMLRNQAWVGHEVLDVTDSANPFLVAQVARTGRSRHGSLTTHKNFWDCETGEAYLVSTLEGWSGQALQIVDLADPAHPRHIRDFGLDGMQAGSTFPRESEEGYSLHEPTVLGDRVYLAYGTDRTGTVQILDRDKLIHGDPSADDPFALTAEAFAYSQIARLDMPDFWGAHSAKPVLQVPIADYANDRQGARRNFLFVTSEGIDFLCSTYRHLSFFIDITDEAHPWPVSTYQVPAKPVQAGDPDFCERGVFGPHGPHASHNPLYEGKVIFLAYFTGGVRAIDMRDPFNPVEVGHFISEATPNSRVIYPPDAGPEVIAWPVANTVEIDERGQFLFMADRPHNGLFILRLTGSLADLVSE